MNMYTLKNGTNIDTEKDLTFDERNFIQKMMIFAHLRINIEDFRQKWRTEGNPVWKGPSTLENPSPAVRILLDLEDKLNGR